MEQNYHSFGALTTWSESNIHSLLALFFNTLIKIILGGCELIVLQKQSCAPQILFCFWDFSLIAFVKRRILLFFWQIEPFEKFRSFFVGSASNPRPLIISQRAPSRHSFVRSHKSNVWEPPLEITMFQSFLCKTLV